MNRYEIYCTAEQTAKAIKIGALIKWSHNRFEDDEFDPIGPDTYAVIPTATQMLGWLESEKGLKYFCIEKDYDLESERYSDTYCWRVVFNDISFFSKNSYETRQEATLAAIDAALDYLIKAKEENLLINKF